MIAAKLRWVFMLIALLVCSQLASAQSSNFFHLLPLSDLISLSFQSASQTTPEVQGVWGNWSASLSAWTNRRRIVLQGTGTALANYPVLIRLNSTRVDYTKVQPDGDDIRFTDAAGNLLNYQIESFTVGGTSSYWVQVPSIAASPTRTTIWLYYGNASASAGASSTAVWDANYTAVYNLNGNVNDSTSNARHGTATSISYGSGFNQQGLVLNGTLGSRVQLPNSTSLANNFTVSVLFKTASDGVLFGQTDSVYPSTPSNWSPALYIGTDFRLRGGLWTGSDPTSSLNTSYQVADDRWHLATLVGSNGSSFQRLFVDGTLIASFGASPPAGIAPENAIGFGHWQSWPSSDGSNWNSFDGAIDMVMISNTARSNNYVRYLWWVLNDAVATFFPEEDQTSGTFPAQVNLANASTNTVTVPYTISGTATSGTDYVLSAGTLTFNPGITSQTISPRILRDTAVEATETIILTLGAATGGAVTSPPSVHTVSITNDANVAPVGVNDSYNLTSLSAVFLNVVQNDTDANGDTLSVTINGAPTQGTATAQGGYILYVPNISFGASDTLTYTVSDGRGGTSATTTVTLNNAVPGAWTGLAGDNLWSNPGNWSGNQVPGPSDIARFQPGCAGANCNVTIDTNVSVAGLSIGASFTGVITQGAGRTISIGNSGWQQAGSSFVGSDAAISFGSSQIPIAFNLTGGTFTSTSATLTIRGGSFVANPGATFNANSGTVLFEGGSGSWTVRMGGSNYNNVTFTGTSPSFSFSNDTVNINGTLTLNSTVETWPNTGTLNNVTINARGNLNATNYGFQGSGLIRASGSSNQTLSGVSTAWLPSLEIASTGGTVAFSNYLKLRGNYTYTSGTVNTTGSTLHFAAFYDTYVLSPGTIGYNNVSFGGDGSTFELGGANFTINGTLSCLDEGYYRPWVNNGSLLINGNIELAPSGCSLNGSSLKRVVGTTNQSSTTLGFQGGFISNFRIEKPSGTLSFSGAGRHEFDGNFTYVSGTVSTGTSNFLFWLNTNGATLTPGPFNYNNVELNIYNSTTTISGTMNVMGDLYIVGEGTLGNNILNSGTLNAYGYTEFRNQGARGSTVLNLLGSTSRNFYIGSTAETLDSTITINVTGASTINLVGDLMMRPTQSLFLQAGTLNLNSNDLNVPQTMTVSTGTSVICNGGIFTAGTVSNSGTIDCLGYTISPFTWTGAGGNSNWNNPGNWMGGAVPNGSSNVVFDGALCGANCNATINVNADMNSIVLRSNYSGTITQGTGVLFYVGQGGYRQEAGTFLGSNGDIEIRRTFSLTGGTFRASSGLTWLYRSRYYQSPDMYDPWRFIRSGSGNFQHNNGLVWMMYSCTSANTFSGNTTFNNLRISSNCAGINFNSATLTVLNDLEFRGDYTNTYNNGTIDVGSNVTVNTDGAENVGSMIVRMTGKPGGQTITGTASGNIRSLPNLTIASGANVVNMSGSVRVRTNTIVSTGSINQNGASFETDSLALGGSTLTKGGGTLTVNGAVVGTGALFGGTVNP